MTVADQPFDEFEELLNALCEEGLTDAQARRLEWIVENDAAACRYYLMYVHLHGILYWNTARLMPDTTAGSSRPQSACEPAAPHSAGSMAAPHPPAPQPRMPPAAFSGLIPPLFSSGLLSYVMAVLVLGVGLLAAWVWQGSGRGQAGTGGPGTMAVGDEPAPEAVARIIGLRDCRWESSSSSLAVGQMVGVGRKFVLAAGKLEIAYTIGDRVTLEGPATYEVTSPTGGELTVGKLSFHSMLADLLGPVSDLPSKGYDKVPIFVRPMFAMRGPRVLVIDKGGDYTLTIEPSGISHAVLAKGKIELRYPHGVKPGDSMGGRCWWYAEGDKTHFLRAVCQAGEMPPALQAEMAASQRNSNQRFVGLSKSGPVDLMPRGKTIGGDNPKLEVGLP